MEQHIFLPIKSAPIHPSELFLKQIMPKHLLPEGKNVFRNIYPDGKKHFKNKWMSLSVLYKHLSGDPTIEALKTTVPSLQMKYLLGQRSSSRT